MFERALERGLEDLWAEFVLAQYLDGELDREEAVERAERRHRVVEADVDRRLTA